MKHKLFTNRLVETMYGSDESSELEDVIKWGRAHGLVFIDVIECNRNFERVGYTGKEKLYVFTSEYWMEPPHLHIYLVKGTDTIFKLCLSEQIPENIDDLVFLNLKKNDNPSVNLKKRILKWALEIKVDYDITNWEYAYNKALAAIEANRR